MPDTPALNASEATPQPLGDSARSSGAQRIWHWANEEATASAARDLTLALQSILTPTSPAWTWHLVGDLGAGKTTWVRHCLRALGYQGRVKSPSYGLMETYELAGISFYHLDLYRLSDPQELLDAGLDEVFHPGAVCWIEWPQKAQGLLPPADWTLHLQTPDPVSAPLLRLARLGSDTERGAELARQWAQSS